MFALAFSNYLRFCDFLVPTMHPTNPGSGVVLDKSLAPKDPGDLRGESLSH